jgi:hypothetical protein
LTRTNLSNTCGLNILFKKMAGDNKPAEGGNGVKPAAAKEREGADGQVSRHKNR